jgi:hypothetical protein
MEVECLSHGSIDSRCIVKECSTAEPTWLAESNVVE